MRFRWIISLTALLFAALASPSARADANVGLNIRDGGVRNFYLAIGNYYQVPERTVVVVRERNIPDEELPVVFFLARHARVTPQTIVQMRLGGKSWMAITLHYGLSPEIFYVALSRDPGPPYGRAYGYYHKRARNRWKEIRLSDAEVVNFVNLRFVSGHYGCSADEVVKTRCIGKSFVYINGEVRKSKDKYRHKEYNTASMSKSKGKGKDRDKDRDNDRDDDRDRGNDRDRDSDD